MIKINESCVSLLPKSVFNCHTWKRLLTIKSLKTSLIMYFQQELFPYFSLFIQLFISTPKSNTTISAIVLTSDISHKIKFFLTWAFRLHSQVSRPNNKSFTNFMVLSSNSFCPHCKTVVLTVNLFCNNQWLLIMRIIPVQDCFSLCHAIRIKP